MIRLTVRATDESVPGVLLKLMQERLSLGQWMGAGRGEASSQREASDALGHVLAG